MAALLATHWWSFMLRGIAAILFGLMTFFVPGVTLLILVLLFGSYALIDGGFNIAAAIRGDTAQRWWVLVLEGVVSILAGLVTFFVPGLTAIALLYVIAAWALVTGVFEIVAAIRLREQIHGEWMLALAGFIAILFGIFLILAPVAGILTLVMWVGAYAIIHGGFLIWLSVKLRRLAHGLPPRASIPI
jgi:uncharacterized membrane protein HdeD (DUF308 family)